MDAAAVTWQSRIMCSETSDQSVAPTLPALVLLVEDSPIIAMNTEAMLLEMAVGGVRIAASVAEALALIEAERFDLAILDVNLGHENSLPVAERLAALGVPIVFATGVSDEGALAGAWGSAPLLKKPYRFADLEQVVRDLS